MAETLLQSAVFDDQFYISPRALSLTKSTFMQILTLSLQQYQDSNIVKPEIPKALRFLQF